MSDRPTPPTGITVVDRQALETYDLKLDQEVTVRTLAAGYAVDGERALTTSVTVIATVVGATSSTLILEGGGTRYRIPWSAVAIITTTTAPVHPGLT